MTLFLSLLGKYKSYMHQILVTYSMPTGDVMLQKWLLLLNKKRIYRHICYRPLPVATTSALGVLGTSFIGWGCLLTSAGPLPHPLLMFLTMENGYSLSILHFCTLHLQPSDVASVLIKPQRPVSASYFGGLGVSYVFLICFQNQVLY